LDQELARDSERRQKLRQAYERGRTGDGGNLEGPVRAEPAPSPFSRNRYVHVPDDLFDIDAYRRDNSAEHIVRAWKEGAKRAVSELTFFPPYADEARAKAHVARLLEARDGNGEFSRHVLVAGSPVYETAYGKSMLGHHVPLSVEENWALRAAL